MVTSHWDSSVYIMALIQFYNIRFVLNEKHNTGSLHSVRIKSLIIPMRSPFQTIRILFILGLFFLILIHTYAPGPRENEHVKTERGNFNRIISYLCLPLLFAACCLMEALLSAPGSYLVQLMALRTLTTPQHD